MKKEICRFFCDETNSKLRIIPHKNKDKIEILNLVIDHFESNVFYRESEVNRILKGVYDDFPLLRRYLVDFNFLYRDMNGYVYWKNNYYEVLDIPNKDEIYRFIIDSFTESTRIPVEFGVVNEILKFDLHFYLNSKLVIFDKTEIRLNKSMFKLSNFVLGIFKTVALDAPAALAANAAVGGSTLVVTAVTNPFLGMVAGIVVRMLGI